MSFISNNNGIFHIGRRIFFLIMTFICLMFALSAFSGKISPIILSKAAILGLFFPIGLICVVTSLIICIIFRLWKEALIPLGTILLCISPILTYSPLNVYKFRASDQEDNFKILTYNVMGFTDMIPNKQSQNRTINYILKTNADVVCIQEGWMINEKTKKSDIANILPQIKEKYPYSSSLQNDLVILSKYPYKIISSKITSKSEKSIAYALDIKGRRLNIINVHLESIGLTEVDKKIYIDLTTLKDLNSTNTVAKVKKSLITKLSLAFKNRADQAEDIRAFLDSLQGPTILCGDFNDMPSSYSYNTIRGKEFSDAY